MRKKDHFFRQTGDNFRSFHLPTQQMSFSILNINELVNSPSGQILQCLWRGPEDATFIEAHCLGMFQSLEKLSKEGVTLNIPANDDQPSVVETFNVVIFYVADLPHLTKVLGRVSTNAMYGCWHCKTEQKKNGPKATT